MSLSRFPLISLQKRSEDSDEVSVPVSSGHCFGLVLYEHLLPDIARKRAAAVSFSVDLYAANGNEARLLVQGCPIFGCPFFFPSPRGCDALTRLGGCPARDQPRQPALPAGEPVARLGDDRRARLGDDVRDLARRGGACLDDLEPGHSFDPLVESPAAYGLGPGFPGRYGVSSPSLGATSSPLT